MLTYYQNHEKKPQFENENTKRKQKMAIDNTIDENRRKIAAMSG